MFSMSTILEENTKKEGSMSKSRAGLLLHQRYATLVAFPRLKNCATVDAENADV